MRLVVQCELRRGAELLPVSVVPTGEFIKYLLTRFCIAQSELGPGAQSVLPEEEGRRSAARRQVPDQFVGPDKHTQHTRIANIQTIYFINHLASHLTSPLTLFKPNGIKCTLN